MKMEHYLLYLRHYLADNTADKKSPVLSNQIKPVKLQTRLKRKVLRGKNNANYTGVEDKLAKRC